MISDQELVRAVEEATSADFLVYGELGREKASKVALLALEHATGDLVVLIVTSGVGPGGEPELSVDVQTTLDARIPDGGTFCTECGTKLRPWGRFCQNCGADVAGQSGPPDQDPALLRAAVEEAISGDFELLGEMKRKEGGRVFFAREKQSGRIAALRLNRGQASDEFELDETMILKRPKTSEAGLSVSVTQLLRKLEPDSAPPDSMMPHARRTTPPAVVGAVNGAGRGVASPGAVKADDSAAHRSSGTPGQNPLAGLWQSARGVVRRNSGLVIGFCIVVVLAILVLVALQP